MATILAVNVAKVDCGIASDDDGIRILQAWKWLPLEERT